MLFLFILGAFGSTWWWGIEVDAPKPGGGDPWWWRLGSIVIGGLTAIAVAQVQPIDVATITGVFVAIGAGKVGATVVGAVLGAVKR